MIALTSGRFDPPHPGHILNICKIAEWYDGVKVVMLDYPGRRFPVSYCVDVFLEIFERMNLNVEFFTNIDHFGEISLDEIQHFKFDIYVGGNLAVLKHLEDLAIETRYIDRQFLYEASKIAIPN